MSTRMREGHTTDDYRNAMDGEGDFFSLGYEWNDKPHRLVYDLCGEVDELRSQLSARDRELAELKRRFREVHKWRCTADNCTLDGGPEHEEYFSGGGMTFDEELAHETKSLDELAALLPAESPTPER